MGVAYYPELFPVIPGYEPAVSVCGKALAGAIPALDALAPDLGVPRISSFHSESIVDTFRAIGEPVPVDLVDTPVVWLEPSEGARVMQVYIDHLSSRLDSPIIVKDEREGRPNRSISARHVLEDLKAIEAVLRVAEKHGSKFRLKIDF